MNGLASTWKPTIFQKSGEQNVYLDFSIWIILSSTLNFKFRYPEIKIKYLF